MLKCFDILFKCIMAALVSGYPLFVVHATASEANVLSFEFPDGSRGGFGKIQGTGPWPRPGGGNNFILERIRSCGLADAHPTSFEVSHRSYIQGTSSPRDKEIAACVKRSVPTHFNAQNADGDRDFRDLWTRSQDMKPGKT